MSSTSPAATDPDPSRSTARTRERLALDLEVDRRFPHGVSIACRRLRTDGPSREGLARIAGAILQAAEVLAAARSGTPPPAGADRAARLAALRGRVRALDPVPGLAAWFGGEDPDLEGFLVRLEPERLRPVLSRLRFLADRPPAFFSRSGSGRWFLHEARGHRTPFGLEPREVGGEPPVGRMLQIAPGGDRALVLDPWLVYEECSRCGIEHLHSFDPATGRLVDPARGCALPLGRIDPPREVEIRLPPGPERERPALRTLDRRYDVVDGLDEAGVLLAVRRPDALPVVLKPFREAGANERLTARFHREVGAARALDHPGLIPVVDAFDDGRRRWIVQEYVDGEDLQSVLDREGRLEPVEAVRVVAAVLDALGHVHSHGWVHRDVKPSNVLLQAAGTASARAWHVRLGDFGLARDTSRISVVTASRAVVGTCHYMSPEQSRGRPAGPATDLYAAGAMLYRCLAGRVPFDGETVDEVMRARFDGRPAPPSTFAPGLPEALDAAVLAALAPDPGDRPAGAAAMARAITEAVGGLEPTHERGRRGIDVV